MTYKYKLHDVYLVKIYYILLEYVINVTVTMNRKLLNYSIVMTEIIVTAIYNNSPLRKTVRLQ